MTTRTARRALPPFLFNAFSIALLIVILFKSMAASTATDGSTPLALTPGAPAGSYPLSGLDHMNPYNGNLSFSLALLGVGGRGDTGYMMTRTIEQHWRVDHVILSDGRELNIPIYNPWTPLDPGYGPGVMYGRQVTDGFCSQGNQNTQTLTRLTFVSPDGTEHELVDKLTMGQPSSSFCWAGVGFARGTVFVSTNGAAITFVSDSTIYDHQFGATSLYPTGYLMLRGGTRLRIVNGRTEWVRDRNGNQVSITYPTSTRMIATDPLGRQFIVDRNVSDVAPYGLCDKITFNGFNGVERYIRVSKRNLGDVLRSGYSLQTPAVLFPGLDGSSSTNHNPQVVSAIWLPDGRSYQFRYNSYGELARAELPTGGAFEYDYAGGLVNGAASGFFYAPLLGEAQIYRRSTEKRVYREGGVLEHKTTTTRTDNLTTTNTTVTVDKLNSTGALLTRSKHYFYGNPAHSFDVEPLEYQKWKHGREYKTEVFNSDGTTVLRRFEHTWQQPVAGGAWPLWQPETNDSAKANNPQITNTLTTLDPTTANHVSQQLFAYDSFLNKTDVWEYGFGVGAPGGRLRRTQVLFLLTNPVNSLDYASPNPTASSIHIRDLPETVRVYSYIPQETLASETHFVYDETALNPWYGTVTQWSSPGTARGNVTKTRVWLNPGNTWLESRAQFDQVGNVSKSWDPKNNATETAYSSTYHFAYPTQTTSAIPDPTGQHGSTTALVSTASYDLSTGLATSTTDANNQTTTTAYNDALNRPTQVVRGVGSSAQTQTTFSYEDGNRTITATSDLNAANDNVLKVQQEYDGLGRTIKTRQYEGGANNILTETQYDALGRAHKVSNPHRPWLSETAVWTTTQFDALGRVISVTTPDNAVVSSSYSGNAVTVTDQAGKVRKSVTDPLGRLVAIYEDPNGLGYLTSYNYDGLDNLIKVTQGSQQRFFLYDSLKRLIRARNPEQGTLASLNLSDPLTGNSAWSIGYQYDANSNLTFKTDARGVVTENRYDALNRVTTILYRINGQPDPNTGDVEYLYDGATNGKGRLWLTYKWGAKPHHTAVGQYDAMGRVTQFYNLFGNGQGGWSAGYEVNRTYNRAGSVTSQTYPSGRSVTYNYDQAGRLADKDAQNLAFTGNLGDGVLRTYSRGISYVSAGQLKQEQFGTTTPVYNKLFYNSRLQLAEILASTTGGDSSWNRGKILNQYSLQCSGASCNATDNNGNLRKQEVFIPANDQVSSYASWYQQYDYDQLNRLKRVHEYTGNSQLDWQQEYLYDQWGNRKIDVANTYGTGINNKSFDKEDATNRLYAAGDLALADNLRRIRYDMAGNQIKDTYTGHGSATFDGDNRIVAIQDNQAGWSYYTYNAEGQRVRRKIGTQETWQIYGIDGEMVAEYAAHSAPASPQKEYGYRNGQLLVTASAATGTNQSLSLNGTSAYVQAPSSSSLNVSGAITVEAWINIDAIGAYRTIISREGFQQAGTGGGYRLAITDTGKVRLDLFQTHSTYVTLTGTTTLTVGAWQHVAGVFDGSQMRVYLNGVLNGTLSTTSGPTSGTGAFYLGRFSYSLNPYYFNGLIDDARVSNAALYTSNFTPSNNLTASASTKGLWKFDGLSTNDSSGNNNHGSVQGGASYSNNVPGTGGGDPPQVRWLIADHLGTPRMILDQTGSLANVKRHDYLPFGEELFAPVGERSVALGYASGDDVRQQFTGKERDVETGLDYFLARYYSSNQGRFASIDPFSPIITKQVETDPEAAQRAFTEWISDPQRWNSYHYALNNPLRVVDPDGKNPQQALEALKRGLQRLDSFTTLAKSLFASGKANLMATATEMALNSLFGNVHFASGGLNAGEVEFAKEISAFEGRSFQGAGKHAQGIDGFLHDGKLPTNNPRPVQLQQNSTGGDYRLFDHATHHERQASSAGLKNMVLYIKATDPNVTVNSVMQFIDNGGTSGFVGLTKRGTFTNVTIFTKDGVVRIENGQVNAMWK